MKMKNRKARKTLEQPHKLLFTRYSTKVVSNDCHLNKFKLDQEKIPNKTLNDLFNKKKLFNSFWFDVYMKK